MRAIAAGFEPVLTALHRDGLHHFGESCVVLTPFARMDRPSSSLLRVQLLTPSHRTNLFVKRFKPRLPVPYEPLVDIRDFVVAEFDAMLQLHRTAAVTAGLASPRPIAVFPEERAIVTEQVHGIGLDRLLRRAAWTRRPATVLPEAVERIGVWLRAYQAVGGSRGTVAVDAQRSYIDTRLQFLAARFFEEDDRTRMLACFDDLAAQLTVDRTRVLIHADLCPANLLVSSDGAVSVLDFAMAGSGAALHDLVHLYLHFEFLRWHPVCSDDLVTALQAALLRGYDPSLRAEEPRFRLMLLQHVVCHVTQLVAETRGMRTPAAGWRARSRWRRCAQLIGAPPGQLSAA